MKFTRPVGDNSGEGTVSSFARDGTRSLLIFSYGLFTIAAQTLLFREFVIGFEGNDISVGIFFASWFLWVGLAAVVVYKAKTFAEKLLKNIEFLFLAYLPAFVLELILIIQARELAGVESYALLSIRTILLLSIVVNAPVSIITGLLFPTACRWVQKDRVSGVSWVYIFEAAGSFVGGLGVTVLLAYGVSFGRIFLILGLILSSSVFAAQLAEVKQSSGPVLKRFGKVKTQLMFLVPCCVLLCLAFGADKALMRYMRVVKWTKLFPAKALAGSFQTAQAEYLYGSYQGQWVAVREGSAVEALPDESGTGRTAAISLCQNPDAKRVLVIGSGLGLCRQFLRLPQTEHVTWAYCDNEYVQQINRFVPAELQISDNRFYPVAGDIRALLARERNNYDVVMLNLPDATSSVLNRYYTLQFYRQVKDSLKPDGVLAVRITGGENIMGTELVNLGASTKMTLARVFSKLVLTPGEETWFIASDSENLTDEPGTLRDRFAAIEGSNEVFASQGLLSVYLPNRAAMALEYYSNADLPEDLLINSDERPLTHLYSLLLAAKQSGASVTKLVKHLALAGPVVFIVPLLVLAALRFIYVLKTTGQGGVSGFDSSFVVFSAGSVGIGVVIVLMYLYQTRFGSLYLHIGVISSIFMAGLTVGAILIRRLLMGNGKIRQEKLLIALILLHTLILTVIGFWSAEQWTHSAFAIAFILCGLCAGSYFPLAAGQLANLGFEAGQTGSKLETADHLGASMGGLLTSLALVPVLGAKVTLFVFILLILANVPAVVFRIYKPGKIQSVTTAVLRLRRLGYVMFGIGVSIILCSNLLAEAGRRLTPLLPQHAAQALAGQSRIEQLSAVIGDDARQVNYFKVYLTGEESGGYIFSSQELAPEIRGFGGRINLAVHMDTAGKLIDFNIIRSNETPVYLEMLTQWRKLLNERQLFQPAPFADVDTVTGATVSSEAILSALETSGHRFAGGVLGRTLQPGIDQKAHWADYLPDTQGMYLLSALVFTLVVIYHGGFWSRLVVLVFNLVVGGLFLNAQYSTEQIATVLSLHSPAIELSGAFLLVVGVPLLAVFFGNIYCGYICPFGAAQELLGFVLPKKFKQPMSAERMKKARFVKYVVLFVLIVVFFISRDRTILAAEPLTQIFGFRISFQDFQLSILLVMVAALAGSVFYTRFWCRYLCPAGAFLSILNNFAVFKRYLPVKRFGRCEFGLTAQDHMDCLYCDKCRYEAKSVPVEKPLPTARYAPMQLLSRYFLVGVLVIALLISAVSVRRFLQVLPAGLEQTAFSVSGGGQPRDIDLRRVRRMIGEKKLSDKEAQFYEKVD
jgi:spermidine synthase